MSICYECGKEIKTKKCILQVPPKYLYKYGEFDKTYHKRCFIKAQKRAGKSICIT